jgi:hypothetical protein
MQKPLASIDLPSTELAKHKAEATKLGLMLKERVENLQCLRIDEVKIVCSDCPWYSDVRELISPLVLFYSMS